MPNLGIGIVVALSDELRALAHLSCGSIRLTRTGMGTSNARHYTETLIREFSPDLVLIAGFAGALAKSVAVCDLVVATRIHLDPLRDSCQASRFLWPPLLRLEIQGEYTNAAPISTLIAPAESRLQVARDLSVPAGTIHFGGLVTTPVILESSSKKEELRALSPDAIAVDMESAGAAAACEQAGVPWLAVRAVTDGIDDELPLRFEDYLDESIGEVSRKRIAKAAMLHPTKVPALMRLGRRSALAARNLAAFVEAYIGRMPVTGSP